MVNVLQSMILTRGRDMVLTPTYHLFRMFRPFQDAVSLPADLSSPDYRHDGQSVPSVMLTSARSKEGAIIVALINLDPIRPVPVSAAIEGVAATQVSGEILTAGTMDAHNSFEQPDLVHPAPFHAAMSAEGKLSLTLPAKSVVVLTLR
jgi:alpha-N-arabinofuranosidase